MRVFGLSLLLLAIPAGAHAQGVAGQLGDPSGATVVVPPPPSYGATVAPGLDPELAPRATPRARARDGYQPMWPVLVPGLAAFVVSYGTAAFAGAILLSGGVTEEGGLLLAPVVGPFILAADRTPENAALFVTMGLSQTAGLVLLITGLAINRRGLHREAEDDASATVVPLLGPDLVGLGALGRF